MSDTLLPGLSSIDPAGHLRSIIESADDAIIGTSLAGVVQTWNPAAERLFGYRAADVLGHMLPELTPPERRDEETALLERIRRGERVDSFETVRRSHSGRLLNVSITLSPIVDRSGQVVGLSRIARNISQRLRAQQLLWLQENYDGLTGMPQRRLFEQDLERRLEQAAAHDEVGVIVVNLDRIKQINDALGRQNGDQVIAMAAGRVREAAPEGSLVSRLGGDEFGVALSSPPGSGGLEALAQTLLQRLQQPVPLGDEQVFTSASLGLAVADGNGCDARALVARAELALHEAKRAGGGSLHRYSGDLAAQAQQRLTLATDLRGALQRDELFLLYQPIVELPSRRICKCEALLRWRHPRQGLVPPTTFIPVAEQTGLIHEVGDWVFRQVLTQLDAWRDTLGSGFQVSLNMSPAQLQPGLQGRLDWGAELQRAGVPSSSLIVEITESMMLAPEMAQSTRLTTLWRAGIELAIDDFGTGYSSLSQLNRFDARYLKIDRSFVRHLHADNKDLVLCRAIVAMAHALSLKVVAEGVETPEQLGLLEAMGCDYAQGYLFGRPMPPDDLAALVAQPVRPATQPPGA